jgi:hypothetical protein
MMTEIFTSPRRGVLAVLATSLALVGCGGGGAQDSGFPSLATSYGTGIAEEGRFTQTYTMNDGETEQYTVTGRITIDTQSEGAWSGRVFRCERNQLSWCYSSGTMAGTIDRDHSLHFSLTQERWKDCTALAPGEYSGVSEASTIYATGVTQLRCDDGREGTVEEIIWVKASAPPGYNPI